MKISMRSHPMAILPISTALVEARAESISELYSRDVESMSDADIDRIIADQRSHRERMEKAEAMGQKTPRAAKAFHETKAPAPVKSLDIQELDF
jgi:hypothetical protein